MTSPMRSSPRLKWVALAIVVCIATILLLLAAEGAVRLRQWSRHGTAASFEALYRLDEKLDLRVLVPGARVGNITVNTLGFRGPEIAVPKPQGRIRIAFLGASTTFCAEASGDMAVWPHLVVERLRARFPKADFDYANGAVPGYTVRTSLRNLQQRIEPLEPDVVVIYHATNDLSQEVRTLALAQGLAKTTESRERSWFAQNLRLWELVEKNLRVIAARRGAESSRGRVVLDQKTLGKEFERNLGKLIDAAGHDGRLVAVATFSTRLRPEQTDEEKKKAAVSALIYMPSMSLDGLLAGYRRYNDIIRAVAQARGALLVEGENDIPGDAQHFADSVHFTDGGSRSMAERVFKTLVAHPRFASMPSPQHALRDVAATASR